MQLKVKVSSKDSKHKFHLHQTVNEYNYLQNLRVERFHYAMHIKTARSSQQLEFVWFTLSGKHAAKCHRLKAIELPMSLCITNSPSWIATHPRFHQRLPQRKSSCTSPACCDATARYSDLACGRETVYQHPFDGLGCPRVLNVKWTIIVFVVTVWLPQLCRNFCLNNEELKL